MFRKSIFIIAYNILFVAVFFILCEFLVRLFFTEIQPQFTDKAIYQDNRYFNSPGLRPVSKGMSNGAPVVVNEFGCRAYTIKIDETGKNWLLIGDSVTMGIGVEGDSTFAGLLQQKFKDVNIYNPSVSGYDVDDYMNVLTYFTRDFKKQNKKIDRVILFWCLNDVYTELSSIETPGGTIRYLFSDFLVFLKTHSRFYYFLKTILFDRPESYYKFDSKFYQPNNPAFKNAMYEIQQMQQICMINNINFMMVLLPYEYQYRPIEDNGFFPQDLIIKSLKPFFISIFDTRFALTGEKIKDYFLYGDGIHFSALGHRKIAQYLIDRFN